MMSNDLYAALQRCIEMVRSGVSLEDSLARYPEHSGELRPLLKAATMTTGDNPMPLAAKMRVRRGVMEQWDRRHAPRKTWWFVQGLSLRWAAVAGLVTLLLVSLGGVGTVAAAEDAMPGSALYSVKQIREDARLWFATSTDDKVEIYVGYVQERANEISTLEQSGRDELAGVSLGRLEAHLSAVDKIRSNQTVIGELNDALQTSKHAGPIEEVLSERPPETYPCLEHTLYVLREARNRVDSSLEKLGKNLDTAASSEQSDAVRLCPQ